MIEISSFDFLNEKWPVLAKLGEFAEKYIYQDSNTTFIKLGIFGESIVNYITKLEDVNEVDLYCDRSQMNKIKKEIYTDLLGGNKI